MSLPRETLIVPLLPKVLFATFDVVPGPSRHSAISQTLLKSLTQHFQVDAITLKSRELSHLEKTERLRILRIPAGKGDYLAQIESFRRALIRQLEGEEYQLVHVRSLLVGAPLAKRKAEFGIKLLVEASRFDSVELPVLHPPLGSNRGSMDRILAEEELCLKGADAVVTPSRVTRDLIGERGRKEGVHLIPDGVNVDLFDWQTVKPSLAPTILYAGSLAPWQGLVTLIEAFDILSRSQSMRLVLLHPGGDEQWQVPLKNLAKNLGISEKVEFRSAVLQEELPEILCQADVCVAPYARVGRNMVQGGFPLKITEYLACRRPVVASRLPMVEEVISDGVEGLLFTPGNADDLSQKLQRLLKDRVLAQQLAEAGYRRARDVFPASRVRRRLTELYRALWQQAKEEFPKSGLELPAEREGDEPSDSATSSSRRRVPSRDERPSRADEDEQTAIFTMETPSEEDARPTRKGPSKPDQQAQAENPFEEPVPARFK